MGRIRDSLGRIVDRKGNKSKTRKSWRIIGRLFKSKK